MYYIVIAKTGKIVDVVQEMSDAAAQEAADYYGAEVYVIMGEHSGYTASPTTDDEVQQ